MAYTPRFLLPAQISAESGGKQFDGDGNPLTSPKGAIGVAQVMPDTGPEAARLAGVPWDENKYKNDPEYNLRLGDAYQGHLDDNFKGDKVASVAAYNAGPGRVAKLRDKYGDSWQSYLPTETKKYVKNVLGVDVDGQGGNGYYNPVSDNIASIAKNLGIPLAEYTVGQPTAGEQAQVASGTELGKGTTPPDTTAVMGAAKKAATSSENYSTFLEGAMQPIVDNMAAVTTGYQRVAAVKTGLAQDFKMRETDLESKIQPLMAKREEIANQIQELDNMKPLDRRLKAVFNPNRYDPRMLRGQLERVEERINAAQSNYEDLNKLRSGVAAASVDATSADIAVLDAGRQSTIAQASLLGQVAGATSQQVEASLIPLKTAVTTMGLEEHQRASMLGRMTGEEIHSLFNQASASADGTAEVQGVKFTVGDLKDADQKAQAQDLSLHSLVNAYRTSDLMTADKVESTAIEHMTYEQISAALADNGMYKGVKLSIPKLTAGLQVAQQARDAQVNGVLAGTAAGQAHNAFQTQQQLMSGTRGRAQEMFGNMPGDWNAFETQVTGFATQWQKGFEAAKAKGVGNEYVMTTMPQLQAMRTQYDSVVEGIATRWGGGNTALKEVASSYLRGNPLSGDAAMKGLITIARGSGLPNGAKLSGPAAQAVEAARSVVRAFDNPQAGDPLTMIMQGAKSQADKDRELQNQVRTAVGAVYANAMTDSLIQSFPQLARTVRDPENPGKMHPFARVSADDFRMAIAHGDNSGYEVIGNQMGVNASTAKIIFQKGPDSAEWQNVAKSKGYGSGQFGAFLGQLQTIQMSETLTALDASHSSHPGFSAGKAYVDFLQNPEVQNKLDTAVNGYGKSNFGAFLVSSAAGGGYRDNWTAYTQAIANQHYLNSGQTLQRKIAQQRSMSGDPFTRFNAVNQAAGLTPQESQFLMKNVRPLVNITQTNDATLPDSKDTTGAGVYYNASNFDQIAGIVRNHKFEDPQVEHIRKKVANQWEAMDALVDKIFTSVSQ